MRGILALTLVLALLLAPGFAPASAPVDEEALRRGVEAASAGRYEEALGIFGRFADRHPGRAEGPFFQAAVYQLLKGHFELPPYKKGLEENLARTLALAEERMRREPGDARAHFFAGLAHGIQAVEAMNEFRYLAALLEGRKMVALLERTLLLDPGLADAYYGLGVYRVRRAQIFWLRPFLGEEVAGGVGMLRRAAREGRWMGALARVDLAWALYREERYDEARRELAPLIARYPDHPLYALARAEGYFLQRDYPRAKAEFADLRRRLAGRADRFSRFYGRFAQWRVARCDFALGRYAEAGSAAREVMEAPDLNSSLLRQVRKGAASMLDRIEKEGADRRSGG